MTSLKKFEHQNMSEIPAEIIMRFQWNFVDYFPVFHHCILVHSNIRMERLAQSKKVVASGIIGSSCDIYWYERHTFDLTKPFQDIKPKQESLMWLCHESFLINEIKMINDVVPNLLLINDNFQG